jgi:Protein of unknown function (DUF982)
MREAQASFDRLVVVRVGLERVVTDVNDAAQILLRDWRHESQKRKAAMDACLQVLRGEAHAPFARRAFVIAALEAKVLLAD